MKDPEQVARIENVARASTAARIAAHALMQATQELRYAIPKDHPIWNALTEAATGVAKLEAISTNTLERMKR